MKLKTTCLLFVIHLSALQAQISLDSLNTFLTGKWDWIDCTPLIMDCGLGRNPEAVLFSRISSNQLQAQVYINSVLVNTDTVTPFQTSGGQLKMHINISHPQFPSFTYDVVLLDASRFRIELGSGSNTYRRDTVHANACAASFSVDPQVTNPLRCIGANDAELQFNVSGGTASYFYQWNNGLFSQAATGLVRGNYSVTVFDSDGCSATASQLITAQFRCYHPTPVVFPAPATLPGLR